MFEQPKIMEWRCTVMNCGAVIKRKLLRKADDGRFPDYYDYTLWESDFDFLMRVITHLARDMQPKVIAAP